MEKRKKRELLTLEEEKDILGKKNIWNKWIFIKDLKNYTINVPGIYEISIKHKELKNRIIIYLGKAGGGNSTLSSRFSSYAKDGSHLSGFFKQFEKLDFILEFRWRITSTITTRRTKEEDRAKKVETEILNKVDYFLNKSENHKRRLSDLNKLIFIKSKEEIKSSILYEVKMKKKENVESIEFKMDDKIYNLDKEGWVLKKDGTRDKRRKGPLKKNEIPNK